MFLGSKMDGECTLIIYCERAFSNTIKIFPGDKDPDSHFLLTSLVCLPILCCSVILTPLTFLPVLSTTVLSHLFLHAVVLSPCNKGKVSKTCLSFVSRIENQPSLWA